VQGRIPTVLKSEFNPNRLAVIEFPSRDNAQAFLADSEAPILFAIVYQTTTSTLLLFDGANENCRLIERAVGLR
jgi:uncharacterized protein (DUF1330 family)